MEHVHHHYLGKSLVAAARGAVERAGEQWTPMREAVFGALTAFERPASAYDIADAVSRSEGRRVAANSVYRILDLFVATDIVRRVESANAFLVNRHPDCHHDCIFLVCDQCGRTTHVDDDRLTESVRAVALAQGFSPDRPVIEVRGRCAQCRESIASAAG